MATDFIQQLKLRQLFGDNPQFGGQVNRRSLFETPEITIPTNAPTTRIPTTPFMDDYRNLLMNAPNRKDYEQGKMGKILALAAGSLTGATEGAGKGLMVGRDILDKPYNQALDDYSVKGGRFKELAELEHRGALEDRKLSIDTRKMELEEFKAISGLALDDARAKELLDRINTRGKSLQKNEKTGQLEVVNMRDGSRVSLGQFAETPGEKDTREKNMFGYKEGVQQKNRKELEGIRFGNDKALAKIKKELENRDVSATQDNAAWEGAYKEIITEYPEMKAKLFETDKDGNLTLRTDKNGNPINPDAYNMFVNSVRERKAIKLGGKSTGFTESNVTAPKSKTPAVTDPTQVALRETAVKFLRDNGFEEDEASITEAIKQIQAVSGSSLVGAPSGQAMPWGPINFDNPMPGGMFKNFSPGNVAPNRERPPGAGGMFNDFGTFAPDDAERIRRNIPF